MLFIYVVPTGLGRKTGTKKKDIHIYKTGFLTNIPL